MASFRGVIFAAVACLSQAEEGLTVIECSDETAASEGTCAGNVTWAMMTGIYDHAANYDGYPELTVNSSRADFQCVLHKLSFGKIEGNGHACPFPCHSSISYCDTEQTTPPPPIVNTTNQTAPIVKVEVEPEKGSSSEFHWWTLCLILGPILCCIGGLLYMFLVNKKPAPKKKKRAVKPPAPPPAEPPTMAAPLAPVQTAVMTAPPQYVQAPMRALPVQTTAVPLQPAYTAAPVYTAQPMPMAQPVYATPQQAYSMFDRLDTNHDGVISRQEFNAMMGR